MSRWIQAIIYFLLVVAGVVGLFSPPPSATFSEPEWPNGVRFAFLAFGGMLSMIAVILDRPYLEQLGIPLILGGTCIYAAALVWKIFSGDVASTNGSVVVLCLVLASGGWIVERYRTVNDLFRGGGGGDS